MKSFPVEPKNFFPLQQNMYILEELTQILSKSKNIKQCKNKNQTRFHSPFPDLEFQSSILHFVLWRRDWVHFPSTFCIELVTSTCAWTFMARDGDEGWGEHPSLHCGAMKVPWWSRHKQLHLPQLPLSRH